MGRGEIKSLNLGRSSGRTEGRSAPPLRRTNTDTEHLGLESLHPEGWTVVPDEVKVVLGGLGEHLRDTETLAATHPRPDPLRPPNPRDTLSI